MSIKHRLWGKDEPRAWVALALMLALGSSVTAGCGGGEPERSNNLAAKQRSYRKKLRDAALAREFVERGNEICATGRERKARSVAALSAHPTLEEAERYALRSEVPNIEQQIERIAALRVPPELRAAVKQLVDVSQRSLDELRARPAKIRTLKELFEPTTARALKLELEACTE